MSFTSPAHEQILAHLVICVWF